MHHESLFADPPFWVAVAFVIFFALFGRKIWQALAALLDKRTAAVRAELAEAQRLRHEAEAMLRDANTRREAALAEATALLEGAQAQATRLAREASAEAEHAARRREQMAMDRIAAAEKAAVDEVRFSAAEIATAAAAQAIREGLTVEADGRLIDHAIAGLPAALVQRRAA
jgi:F-type H+-transporting ATPase subunit b